MYTAEPGVGETERRVDGSPPRVLLGRFLQLGPEQRVAEVVGEATALKLGERGELEVARSPTEGLGVDGDDAPLEAGGLAALDEARRQVAIGGRVELEEAWRLAEPAGDVLERV